MSDRTNMSELTECNCGMCSECDSQLHRPETEIRDMAIANSRALTTELDEARAQLAAVTQERDRNETHASRAEHIAHELQAQVAKLTAEAERWKDCHGDPPVCGACTACLNRALDASEAQVAKLSEENRWLRLGTHGPTLPHCECPPGQDRRCTKTWTRCNSRLAYLQEQERKRKASLSPAAEKECGNG